MQEIRGKETISRDTLCKCEEGDIGLKYLCGTVTTNTKECFWSIVSTFNKNGSTYQRIRKQLSFNSALSSIAGMLDGATTRMRDQSLQSRIRMMG